MTLWTDSPWLVRIIMVICAIDVAFCATALTCQAVRARLAERRFRRYLAALQLEADELLAVSTLAHMIGGTPGTIRMDGPVDYRSDGES